MPTLQTIGVRFANSNRVYTYKVPAHLIAKVGDKVKVPVDDGWKAVQVVEVHATPVPETRFKIKEILEIIEIPPPQSRVAQQ